MATIAMPQSAKKPQNVVKEDAMWLQKEMINSSVPPTRAC